MNLPKLRSAAFILAVGILCTPAAARAVVIVQSTGPVTTALAQTSPSSRYAVEFVSPTVATTITSVVLPLSGSGSTTVTLSLYDDSGGLPGAALASLGQVIRSGSGDFSFVPPSPVALAPSTSYFLVLACTDCSFNGQINSWGVPNLLVPIVSGLPGVSASPHYFASGGGAWGVGGTYSAPNFQVNGQIRVVAVPTLSAWTVALLSLLLLGVGQFLLRRP